MESTCKIRSPQQPQANINPFTPNNNFDNSSSVSTSTTSNSSVSLLNSNHHDLVNENNFINNQLSETTFNSFLHGPKRLAWRLITLIFL
jgi:hypothetical protein